MITPPTAGQTITYTPISNGYINFSYKFSNNGHSQARLSGNITKSFASAATGTSNISIENEILVKRGVSMTIQNVGDSTAVFNWINFHSFES